MNSCCSMIAWDLRTGSSVMQACDNLVASKHGGYHTGSLSAVLKAVAHPARGPAQKHELPLTGRPGTRVEYSTALDS